MPSRVELAQVTASRSKQLLATGETTGDPTNLHKFVNDGRSLLVVRNTGASTRTLEVVIQARVDGVLPAVKSYSILAGEHAMIGPFPPGVYSTTDGLLEVNVDHADLKLQVWSIPG